MTIIEFCVWLICTILFGCAFIESLVEFFKDRGDKK